MSSFREMAECARRLWAGPRICRPSAQPKSGDPSPSDEKAPQPRVVGTPAYMAPEQWRGHECQPATDVWALGLILHELIAGERPYSGHAHLQLGFQVCSADPVPTHSALDGLPPRVSGLIKQCLSKTPEDRPTITTFIEPWFCSGRRETGRAWEESPFRGLLPFSERHASLFFGRDSELNTCMERLRCEASRSSSGLRGLKTSCAGRSYPSIKRE